MTAGDGERSGTFVVESTDETAVVLQDVATAQVHTVATGELESAIDEAVDGEAVTIAAGTVLEETTIVPAADGVTWTVAAIGDVRRVPVERVDLEPTKRSREAARTTDHGELTTFERAGTGSVHVLAVPPAQLEAAVTDVLEDPATRRRAARLGVDRVEIRTGTTSPAGAGTEDSTDADVATGVLSVRYVPN